MTTTQHLRNARYAQSQARAEFAQGDRFPSTSAAAAGFYARGTAWMRLCRRCLDAAGIESLD